MTVAWRWWDPVRAGPAVVACGRRATRTSRWTWKLVVVATPSMTLWNKRFSSTTNANSTLMISSSAKPLSVSLSNGAPTTPPAERRNSLHRSHLPVATQLRFLLLLHYSSTKCFFFFFFQIIIFFYCSLNLIKSFLYKKIPPIFQLFVLSLCSM